MPTHLPVLPDMKCPVGCDACCSDVVTVNENEMVRIVSYANERGIMPQVERPEMCVWWQKGQCAVWAVRPLICATYGHVDHPSLTCPIGHQQNVPPETAKDLIARTSALFAEALPTRFLHEVIDAALETPEDSIWRARVQAHVWDGMNTFRVKEGLAPLARSHRSNSEGRIVPNE